MNNFMNALYNAIGSYVTGYHNGTAFIGQIADTRMKYGGDIGVTVNIDLEESDLDYATVLIDGSTLHAGKGGVYSNLHVYFD
jgi:hypothetical protein